MSADAELAFWIMERYAIKERRAAGVAKPWTADPVLQRVRFCNVHREDDAVTQWIRKNWNLAGDPAWRFVLARMINLPSSLASVVGFTDPNYLKSLLKEQRDAGYKIFTSAYTISTCGKAMDKLDYVFDVAFNVQLYEDRQSFLYDTCEGVQAQLTQIDGLGSFLSAQVVADMKNTPGHPLTNAPDWWTFSAPGPGSLRGLSWWLYGAPTGVTARGYAAALAACRAAVDPLVLGLPRIGDQDFQNCLCEFSKYMKVRQDPKAHVRNTYQGA